MPQVIQLRSVMEVLWLVEAIILLLIASVQADTMDGKLNFFETVKASLCDGFKMQAILPNKDGFESPF